MFRNFLRFGAGTADSYFSKTDRKAVLIWYTSPSVLSLHLKLDDNCKIQGRSLLDWPVTFQILKKLCIISGEFRWQSERHIGLKNGGDRFVAEVVVRPRHKGHHPAFQKVHMIAYFGSESWRTRAYKLATHFSTNNFINPHFSPQTSGLPGPASWKHPLWHHLWDIWKVLF